jgi:pimeloyl-ACP methyl ester carboxylesterase
MMQRRKRRRVVRLGAASARRFRIVRPDMRGFGESTPMPRDFRGRSIIIDDYVASWTRSASSATSSA